MPGWWNWQTHYLEGVAGETPWGFESPFRHQFDEDRFRAVLVSLMLGLLCTQGADHEVS